MQHDPSFGGLPLGDVTGITCHLKTDTTRLDETHARFARGGILIHRLTSIIPHVPAEVKSFFLQDAERCLHPQPQGWGFDIGDFDKDDSVLRSSVIRARPSSRETRTDQAQANLSYRLNMSGSGEPALQRGALWFFTRWHQKWKLNRPGCEIKKLAIFTLFW